MPPRKHQLTRSAIGDDSRTLDTFGDQQLAILDYIWRQPGATVREVWEHISPERTIAYTSILSAVQKLERASWLRHEKDARAHRYFVNIDREQAAADALARIIDRVYQGDRSTALRDLFSLEKDHKRGSDSKPEPQQITESSGQDKAPTFYSLRDFVNARRHIA